MKADRHPSASLLGAPRSAIGALVVFSFFANLLMLTLPMYMLQLFDRVLSSRSVETLVLLTIAAIAALLTSAILEAVRSSLLMRLANNLHARWSAELLSNGGSGISAQSHGNLRDLNELKSFVSSGGVTPLLDGPWIPAYLLVLYLFNPLFATIGLVGALAIGAVVVISEARLRGAIAGAQNNANAASRRAEQLAMSGDTLKALGMTSRMTDWWENQSKRNLSELYHVNAKLAGDTSAARFIRMTVQISVLASAAYLVTLGQMTPGLMIAGSILISRALAPLEQLIGGWRTLVSAKGAYDRVRKATEKLTTPTHRPLERPQGNVTLDRITTIAGRRTLLNGLRLNIRAGEVIAITGPSGAGKSVLVRTLLGLLNPSLGKVLVDDVELTQWNPDELGQYVGYLPQEAPLFEGSVGLNIARMDPAASAEDIMLAGRRAHAHEMILALPNGYEQAAADLPPGVQRRVALARAMYGDPRLVVLDEPETYLDLEGEQALLKSLAALKRAAITTVVVTHRPQILVGIADRVVKLIDGAMVAVGPASEVLPQLPNAPTLAPLPDASRSREGQDTAPVAKKRGGGDPGSKPAEAPASAQHASSKAPARGSGSPASEAKAPSGDSVPAEGRRAPARAKAPPPLEPSSGLLEANVELAAEGKLTLGAWLHEETGSLGQWVVAQRGRAGQRYLARLRRRVGPMLELPLQKIDAEALARWRSSRVDENAVSIERAAQQKRFNGDRKVLLDMLARALEWKLLREHPLVPGSSRTAAATEASAP